MQFIYIIDSSLYSIESIQKYFNKRSQIVYSTLNLHIFQALYKMFPV